MSPGFLLLAVAGSSLGGSAPSRDYAGARAAFLEAYKVLMHPRCVNCHPAGDAPLQGEDSRPHTFFRLRRGADGHGVFTVKCVNLLIHRDAWTEQPDSASITVDFGLFPSIFVTRLSQEGGHNSNHPKDIRVAIMWARRRCRSQNLEYLGLAGVYNAWCELIICRKERNPHS